MSDTNATIAKFKIDIIGVMRFSLQKEFERISESKDYKVLPRYKDVKALSDGYLEYEMQNWAKETGRTTFELKDFEGIAKEILKDLMLVQVCPRCGNEEIGDSDNFCKICGMKIIRKENMNE